MTLTRPEMWELRDLLDHLIAATDDHVCWLGAVRETSLELHDRLTHLLDNGIGPTAGPSQANWKCPAPGCRFAAIHPIGHPCPL